MVISYSVASVEKVVLTCERVGLRLLILEKGRKMRSFIGVLLLSLAAGGATDAKEPADDLAGPPFVSAKAWAIVDGKTGKLLWGHNQDLPCKSASTTKIMCAWLVLGLAKDNPGVLEEKITFSKFADDTVGSTSGIKAGESLTVGECLYGLLLPSGNDAGNALAEHFNSRFEPAAAGPSSLGASGETSTRSNFIAEMNRRAKTLGMSKTTYRSPYGDGGTAADRTTTPRDLLRLAWTAMQDERFRKYVATQSHVTTLEDAAGQKRQVTWTNTNQLLDIDGFDGVKTGTNEGAGACLVSSGHRGDDHLLVVVLGATSPEGRYVDTKNLFRWAWRERGHEATSKAKDKAATP